MKYVIKDSPNFNARPAGVPVDCIVLHADASADAKASVSWIVSSASKVSYHTLIDRDGTAYRFVDPFKRAWHAGVSTFGNRQDVNDFSLGLSFANKNDGKEKYTDAQYQIGAEVVVDWMRRFPHITLERITTHAIIAPGRKTDPVAFDMTRFKALVVTLLATPPLAA